MAFVAGLCLAPATAPATWSIVAVDPETHEVGAAGASCIGGAAVIAALVPGRGVIVAQAFVNFAGRRVGAQMLAQGATPQEVIARLATARFDWLGFLPFYQLRQYGVAALARDGQAAAFTGSWTRGYQGDAQDRGVSAQGNTLRSELVVTDTLRAFQAVQAPGRLADRLLAGLEAGAAQGGDVRCSAEQTALSAFLMVACPCDADTKPSLHLVTDNQVMGGANPVTLLRAQYSEWQRTHPAACPGCPVLQSPDAGSGSAYQ